MVDVKLHMDINGNIYKPKENIMTREQKKQILEVRLNNVKSRGKHKDNPGIVRKLERQLRNLMN